MYSSGVRVLIWMCVIFYLLQHMYFPIVHDLFGLAYIGHPNFKSIQFLTYGFLHGDMYHIFFNMFFLAVFGSKIESELGTKNLFALFALAVVCGGIAQQISHMISVYDAFGTMFPLPPTDFYEQVKFSVKYGGDSLALFNRITLGASAGVFGCMLAFTCLFPRERLNIPLLPLSFSTRLLVIIYVVSELIHITTGPSVEIAHSAHLGGAFAGLVLGLIWRRTLKSKNNA